MSEIVFPDESARRVPVAEAPGGAAARVTPAARARLRPGEAFESKYLGRFVYYYVRVTCVSGARAWSSPVWARL